MVVSYSSLDRFEIPRITLCNPGSVFTNGLLTNTVGMLTDISDMEIVFNFNSISELNFVVTKPRTILEYPTPDIHESYTPEEVEHIRKMYNSIQNRRLLFVEGIGYFAITNVENVYDGGISYKSITAESIESEIQQKMIPYIQNGTYRFVTASAGTDKGLLNTIVETLPLWNIGYIDYRVAARYRTFEDVDTSLNCLGFLIDEMQDAYECIILFNPISRTINVYDQSNYVRQTDIHITKDDVIKLLNINENADDIYTAISVLGGEDVTISAINPIGTNTIFKFDYYLDWMTPGLKRKVIKWQNSVSAIKSRYYELNLQYYKYLEKISNYESELGKIDIQITMYKRCRDNIVAESSTSFVDEYNSAIVENGGTPITIFPEISQTLSDIDALIIASTTQYANTQIELNRVKDSGEKIKTDINAIHDSLAFEQYFTEKEMGELENYIFEGSYTDDYVTFTDIMTYEEKFDQMEVLYKRAETRLQKVSQPTQEFNIDVENFIFSKDFEHWSKQLETGCLINAEIDDGDIAALFLSNITINYTDHSLSMTFGNRFNKFDPRSLFEDTLGTLNKSANTISYIKDMLYPIKNGELGAIKEAVQTSRDLTMGSALASENEEIVIDGSGYTGKKLLANGTYDPRQVKITGKTIVFTDDAWESSKTAIGEFLLGDGESVYGVNAQTLVGDVIMGNNLRIVDSDGNDIFTVISDRISSQIGDINSKVSSLEQTAEGINIRVTNIESEDGDTEKVKTTAGYTFDANGLDIYRQGDEMRTLINNTGVYVTRSGEEIFTANNDEVVADNFRTNKYLQIGLNSRFENYSNGTDTKRTACFFVGDETEEV